VFVTHLHADHIGDLPGMILYPWGVRTGPMGRCRRCVSTGRRGRTCCPRATPPSAGRPRSTRNGRRRARRTWSRASSLATRTT
jgi:ribonuclease BN (tRNA processing enzyme)